MNIKQKTHLSACIILGLNILASCSGRSDNDAVYKDSSRPVEERVSDLLSRMTVDEKIGQLNQRSFFVAEGAGDIFGPGIESGAIGSLLNVPSAELSDSLQKIAIERSRLGIPLLIARDVIHGYKTIMPIPLGQAATFDTAVVADGARVAAVEASSDGIRWTFAPMIDISRDPRWGRIAESFGEDVCLTSLMGRAMVRGFQGDDNAAPSSIAACAKHFVGYGASQAGRDYNSTYIPERQLREIYLTPFEEVCKEGCLTYMSSFNDNDGIPASGNRHVLTDILRGEWNFDGFVVSDWASVAEMINHGFCADRRDAARKGFTAGVDMEMESGTYLEHIKSLIDEGLVSMDDIDRSVANILRVKFRLGLFENPYIVNPQSVKYCKEHLDVARRAALESVIMLKNDKATLPLDSNRVGRILVTGPMAHAPHDQLGTWVFDGEKDHTVTLLDALRDRFGDKTAIIYEPGLDYSRHRSDDGIARAVAAARSADVIIAAVGEESILSGEAHSVADLNLVGDQSRLIAELAKTGKPLITVIMAGRPLTIGREADASDAVLYAFHPGTMGGPALADLIFGVESPSGKTPVTFVKHVGQVPTYYSRNNTGRPASGSETLLDDIELEAGQTSLGCTSFWLDAGFGPLYPFGYGLSYGKFDYSDLSLDKDVYGAGDTIAVSFRLTNSGSRKATEVAQLYVTDKVGSVTRPVRELKGFRRVSLAPGEDTVVRFELPVSDLAFYGIDMTRAVEPGAFAVAVGGDSDCTLSQDFEIK